MTGKRNEPTIWEALAGSVWHVTSLARFRSMVAGGSLLIRPPLKDAERWHTGSGPEKYPFVRKIDGISLFDFTRLNPAQLRRKVNAPGWLPQFVPVVQKWETSIWIEIDVTALGASYLDAPTVIQRWRASDVRGVFLESVEAASLVDIPVENFKRILAIAEGHPYRAITPDDVRD